jgi:hypothetical protein
MIESRSGRHPVGRTSRNRLHPTITTNLEVNRFPGKKTERANYFKSAR